MKPVRPQKAAGVYGKAECPFPPTGPAGGWCGTGSGELWIFLPRNRIVCQVENPLYLDRCSTMNPLSTELHRKIGRAAGRAPSEAANAVPAASKMRPKRGGRRRKIWKTSKDVWKPCNPLKSHKTAKDLFGKAWSKTRDFWEKLGKRLGGRLYSATVGSLPPAASDRAGSSLRGAKRPRRDKAKPRIKKVDSGNANTTIDRHCEEPLRRSHPGAACCGPWIASLRSQ
jgi:hypothetical protein